MPLSAAQVTALKALSLKLTADAAAAQSAAIASQSAAALAISDAAALSTAVGALVADPPAPTPVSPPPTPTPAPNQVTKLTASATAQGEITVAWTAPLPAPTGYKVGRDGTDSTGAGPWAGDAPAGTTTWKFDKLTDATLYHFTITPTGGVAATVAGTTSGAAPTPAPTPTPTPTPTPAGVPTQAQFLGATAPLGYTGTAAPKLVYRLDPRRQPLPSGLRLNRSGGQDIDGGFNQPGTEANCYAPSQVSVVNGEIVFTSARNDTGFQTGYPLKSGTISTEGSFNGMGDGCTAEALIWNYGGPQAWQAFCLYVSNAWPPEVDIFEAWSGQNFTFNNQGDGSGMQQYAGSEAFGSYHVFGCRFSGGKVMPVLDGKVRTDLARTPQGPASGYFLELNLAVQAGGNPHLGPDMRIAGVQCFSGTG